MISIMHFTDLPCENPWLNGIAANFDRDQFTMSVATLGARNGLHAALEQRGIHTFSFDASSRKDYPKVIWQLRKLLRNQQVDILQTHLFEPSAVGLAAAKLAGTPLRIVTRHHSDFTTQFNKPFHRRIDRWQALAADHVMAASNAVKQAMIKHEHVPEDRITVARYGYDFEVLRPKLTPDERREKRDSLGGDDRLLIGTVSRMSIEKGHRYLFDAMPQVIEKYPNVLFLLAGTGPLKEEFERNIAASGLSDHVRFLGWRSDCWEIIEAVDVMVHPTLHEAFCSVIIESLALETPLVATDVAAAPEQIDHNETGLMVPARDPEALSTALLQLLENPEFARNLAREARVRTVERLNFPRMMRLYEDCYRECLAKKRR
jgi:glycosyltransferase involved in cell wall biosynthesis